jgi:SsrA-binding protein
LLYTIYMSSVLIHNRKASFNYEILERFEAGIELTGPEVKSLRAGQGALDGAFVTVRGAEAFITGMTIPPYQVNNQDAYEPDRPRKLLLTKAEIKRLSEIEKGLTIVPISVYNKGRWMKLEIASVRGKKQKDKRQTLKKRDTERQIRREYSDR